MPSPEQQERLDRRGHPVRRGAISPEARARMAERLWEALARLAPLAPRGG